MFADVGDGPAVAVLDPVGGGGSSRRSLARVMITSPTLAWFPSSAHLPSDRVTVEATIAGAAVEFGDQLAGGGEHDRVKSGSLVEPSSEGILGGLGKVADVDAIVIEVEVERCRFAVAEGEGCCCFGGVSEAVQLGEAESAVGVCDVAEDTAGADRGELLIITNKPDACTASQANCTAVSRVRVSAIPASSMITRVDGPTAVAQSGSSPCRKTR